MTATEQINALLWRAADLAIPLEAITVPPAFWAALEIELRARQPEPVAYPRLSFRGPMGEVEIRKGRP